MQLNYNDTINTLPAFKDEDLHGVVKEILNELDKTIIVLDDDPTGTQTIHSIPVLTVWDVATIDQEVKNGTRLFYFLTNSRSMIASEADELHRLIGENITKVFKKFNKQFIIISRGDSTLRGHYPNDIIALAVGLQLRNFITVIVPAFLEGFRYTIDDVQYVKEGEHLIPVAETSFAKDKAFGFSHSNLKKWIEEKSSGLISATDVVAFTLTELRGDSIERLITKLKGLPQGSTCIVNAVSYLDLEKFALAYLKSGVHVIFRTAASFVKAISGKESRGLMNQSELTISGNYNGGLIIVGSYVAKTTKQLQVLHGNKNLSPIEVNVDDVLGSKISVQGVTDKIEKIILEGKDVVIYTSRILRAGIDEKESLSIGNRVADFITSTIKQLKVIPKFIIAKGGITSSDIATKALNVRRAIVLGQALPGVPVWKLGDESKFPGLPYIIFPGNVGDDNALTELYIKLSTNNN